MAEPSPAGSDVSSGNLAFHGLRLRAPPPQLVADDERRLLRRLHARRHPREPARPLHAGRRGGHPEHARALSAAIKHALVALVFLAVALATPPAAAEVRLTASIDPAGVSAPTRADRAT